MIQSIITDGASSAPETAASFADIGSLSSLSNFGQQGAGGGLGFLNPSGSQFGGNQQLLNAQFGGNQQFANPSFSQFGGGKF